MTTVQSFETPLPPAIRALAAKATELQQQHIAGVTDEGNKETSDVTPAVDPAPADPAPAAAADPAPVAAAETPPAPPPAPVDADLEHRLRSAEGRATAFQRDLHAARMRIAELEAENEVLKAAKVPQADTAFITDKEREEYTPEFFDVVGRRAQELLTPLQRQLEDLSARVARTDARTEVSTTLSTQERLTQIVPNWAEINQSDAFVAWVNQVDELSGQIRQSLLQSAYDQGDAARTAAFFQKFLTEHSPTAPQADPKPTPAAAQPQVALEDLAAPGRAKPATAGAPAVADKPIITGKQVADFYLAVQKGRYRGREDEKLAFERAIWDAQREGRFQP